MKDLKIMTPWLEAVHAASLLEKRAFSVTAAVERFGSPPLADFDAGRQLRGAHEMGYFGRTAGTKGEEHTYTAISRAIIQRRAPTAEEFLTHVGRVRSIFDLGEVLTHSRSAA